MLGPRTRFWQSMTKMLSLVEISNPRLAEKNKVFVISTKSLTDQESQIQIFKSDVIHLVGCASEFL